MVRNTIFTNSVFRAMAWMRHRYTAKNTRGNGIHSPHLYYIVRMLFYDNNTYYCFKDIEKQRERLLRCKRDIHVTDYGTGTTGTRNIAQIAKTSLSAPSEGQLLFRLVHHLKPQHIIELGTSLGITTSYLAQAVPQSTIYTLEGSEQIAAEARKTFDKLHLTNIKQVIGNIDTTLAGTLTELPTINFAFIDANHTEEATWQYFDAIAKHCTQQSIIVLDDIHYSRGMENAWNRIQQDQRVSSTMDLYHIGIVFFDKQYWRKHYRLRV